MSTDPRGQYRVRASDTEREQYAEILRAAMSEGRLTLEEGEERLAQVYAAKYRDELSPLTADLPDGGRQALYDTPEAHDAFRKGMRRHIGIVGIVAAVLVGLWILSGAHFFWPIFPLLFLWFGVRRHLRWRRWQSWGGPGFGRGWGGPGGGWGPGRGWGGPGDGGWGPGHGWGPGRGDWGPGGPPPWEPGRTR